MSSWSRPANGISMRKRLGSLQSHSHCLKLTREQWDSEKREGSPLSTIRYEESYYKLFYMKLSVCGLRNKLPKDNFSQSF